MKPVSFGCPRTLKLPNTLLETDFDYRNLARADPESLVELDDGPLPMIECSPVFAGIPVFEPIKARGNTSRQFLTL